MAVWLQSVAVLQIILFLLLAVTNGESVGPQSGSPCLTKPVSGPCRAYLQRWAWDSVRKDCVRFIYGGCSGNGNNFLSKEACVDSCLPKVEPANSKDGICPLLTNDGMCENQCEYDDSCPGDQKCCSNNCGRVCVDPADPRIFQPKPKPGQCPSKTSDIFRDSDCVDVCYIDDQCPGDQKCCPNHCGSSCFDVAAVEKPEVKCDKHWTVHNGTCYKFVNVSRSLNDAAKQCSQLNPLAHLADLKTEWELTWAKSFLQKQDGFDSNIGAWIGLKIEHAGMVWSDGTHLSYAIQYTTEGQDNDDPCMCLHESKDAFSPATCDDEKQYLCQYQLNDVSSAQEQTGETSNKNFVVDMYIIIGIIATVVMVALVVGLLLYMKYRRRVIWTGDNQRTVVKYEGYAPVLL